VENLPLSWFVHRNGIEIPVVYAVIVLHLRSGPTCAQSLKRTTILLQFFPFGTIKCGT